MTPPPATATEHPWRTRALILSKQMTLSRDERLELGAMLVDHHGSWTTLTEDDARRISDALHAYAAVQYLLHNRAKAAAAHRSRR